MHIGATLAQMIKNLMIDHNSNIEVDEYPVSLHSYKASHVITDCGSDL